MKKLLLSFVLIFSILAGCQQADEQTEQVESYTASFEVTDGEDMLTMKDDVEFEKGQSVLEVLKDNFELDETDGFINGINGYVADQSKQEFWAFLVNGEMAMKGAADIELENGDTIRFDLQTWE